MVTLRTVVTVLFILLCIAIVIIVLRQEGKSGGLAGMANASSSDTFWEKNKGRSLEGKLAKITGVLVAAFIVVSLVLNLNWGL